MTTTTTKYREVTCRLCHGAKYSFEQVKDRTFRITYKKKPCKQCGGDGIEFLPIKKRPKR